MPLLSEQELFARVDRLAAIPNRGSASGGERFGAELIAAELRELGLEPSVEQEQAHGTYWWPVGLATGLAAAAGFTRSRLAAAAAGAFAAAAVADDITGGKLWFRRRFLPQRTTTNVVASIGPDDAPHTVLLVAHHDAAHSGLVFHPGVPQFIGRKFPKQLEKTNTTPPTMWGAFYGPLLTAAGAVTGHRGAQLAGASVSAGYAAAMTDIGARAVVPGANDNLSAVAALLSLAHSLSAEPLPGLRVMFAFVGSEESFMEGMQAFAKRHFPSLPKESTTVLVLDTVGSPHLSVLEGEGMLYVRDYPERPKQLLKDAAEELDVWLYPNLRFRNATDALIALNYGYQVAMLGSVTDQKAPANYHWPTDTAENVNYTTVANAAAICRTALTRISQSAN